MPKTFKSWKSYRKREAFLHIRDIPHSHLATFRFLKKRGYGEFVVIAENLRAAWRHLAESVKLPLQQARRQFRLVEIRRPLATGRRRIERL